MKVGIDCRKIYDTHLNVGAGVERYVYHLVKNLLAADSSNEYVLFFYGNISPETIHKIRGHNSKVKIVKMIRTGSKIPLWDSHIKFSHLMGKHELNLAIFPANVMPLFYRGKSILVIHDLVIYLHPKWFPERQWFSTKILVPRSIRRARTIVTVSQSTKDDLLKLFRVPEEKVKVIYPGIVVKDTYLNEELEKIRRKFDIVGKYILFIGTIEPRKNILKLIGAFSNYLFENEESQVSLVLAGIKGWKFKPFFQQINEINKRLLGSRIKYVGKVSNRERNILLKSCSAFVFPSYYEGFGFPVLEAMALGAPVITSNTSSLGEIAGAGAYLINPDSQNDIRRAIKLVLEDKVLRQALITRGKERASRFTWEATIKEFQNLIK